MEVTQEAWMKEGIVCKLVDFGESRAALQQTATLCHTRTNNLECGTIVYMAPELIASGNQPFSIDQLKGCDVWALGMIIFMLINPDLQHPFEPELDQLPQKNFECAKKELATRLLQKVKPIYSNKYSAFQATVWMEMENIFTECTRFCPADRPSVSQIVKLLQERKILPPGRRYILLTVSQSTAVECHDKLVAAGAVPLDNVSHDATNSCAFLSVIITDLFLAEHRPALGADKWKMLAKEIENSILTSPCRFNPLRNIQQMYDVEEACVILRNAKIVTRKFELREELLTPHEVFTKKGRDALMQGVQALYTGDNETRIGIYTCGGYIFVIGCQSNQMFLVDTHPISEQLGGDGNGLLKVHLANDPTTPVQLCAWIWKRLHHSGVSDKALQSLIIFKEPLR